MEQVDASIARYLRALDRADREESDIAEAKSVRLKDAMKSWGFYHPTTPCGGRFYRSLRGLTAEDDVMNAREVMSRNPIAVPAEAGLAEALRLMFDHRISGLPVVDGKAGLVGILTEGDLLRRSEIGTAGHRSRWLDLLMTTGRLASDYVRTHARRVGEIMTRDVVSVAEDTPLTEVVRLMERHRIKRVPVLRDGALIGILSRADLLRAIRRLLVAEPKTAASDETVRQHVLAELARAPWAPHGLTVDVVNGVVTLDGVILDERMRRALRVAAENVPGVKAVADRIVWVEPHSGMIFEAPSGKES